MGNYKIGRKEYNRQYWEKNSEILKEKYKDKKKKYLEEHKEEARKRASDYYYQNKEKIAIKYKTEEYKKRARISYQKHKNKRRKDARDTRLERGNNKYGDLLTTVQYENLSHAERISIISKRNGFNPKPRKSNKSTGIKNISFEPDRKGYKYSKTINGARYLERFKTLEEAIKYKEWFEETHFTKEQKELARKLGEIDG